MIRSLVIEDDPATRVLLERLLQLRGHEVSSCGTAEEAFPLLERAFHELIFLDLGLPGMGGLEFCRRIRSQVMGDRYYILVGTANDDPSELQHILSAGADDYMPKPYSVGLLNIRLAIAETQVAALVKRKALEAELLYLARHDALTKLNNRSQLDRILEQAIQMSRSGCPCTLLYVDLDNFKIINDTCGHSAGDRLLVTVARLLQESVRSGDAIIRFGGDEFVLVLHDLDSARARDTAEVIRDRIDRLVINEEGSSFRIGASIGMAAVPPNATATEVLAMADSACYVAKARGRNRVEMHEPDQGELVKLIADTDWARRIRDAMRDKQLSLWYQPVVRLDTREAAYNEVLVRYTHPVDGTVVSPGAFLTAVQRSGRAVELDRYMVERVAEKLQADPKLKLSMNLSGESFSDADFLDFVERTMRAAEVRPENLIFEITETLVISNLQQARAMIQRLQGQGFQFALDDFGVGFSSMHYLKDLPVNIVKIDGTFVRDLDQQPINQAIVRAIVEVAGILELQTVAEYVETEATLAVLRSVGIHSGQGYYFGKPAAEPMTGRLPNP